MLKVENLTKVYPNGTQALKNVSFEVKDGEFLAVIGLSGSGKSTLLRCINRLIEPTSGKIIWNDQDVTAASRCRDTQDPPADRHGLPAVQPGETLFGHGQCDVRPAGICQYIFQFPAAFFQRRTTNAPLPAWSRLAWSKKRMSAPIRFRAASSNAWASRVP